MLSDTLYSYQKGIADIIETPPGKTLPLVLCQVFRSLSVCGQVFAAWWRHNHTIKILILENKTFRAGHLCSTSVDLHYFVTHFTFIKKCYRNFNNILVNCAALNENMKVFSHCWKSCVLVHVNSVLINSSHIKASRFAQTGNKRHLIPRPSYCSQ